MAAHYLSQYVDDGIGELCRLQEQFNALDNPVAKSRLNEVFPFTLGLLRPVDRPKALDTAESIVSDDVLQAIFLETKAYAHPAWLRLYGRIMQMLAKLATSPDPGNFAADVHLLTVLANDAATHGAPIEIEGRSFEEQLIELSSRGGVFLSRLLHGLSDYDAVAAFRVAQACGLAPLDQAADFVRSGFEQPAFTLFALDRMRQEGEGGSWIRLALEAGLTFYAVNQAFRHVDKSSGFGPSPIPVKRQSWRRYVDDNLLGWLFDQGYYGRSLRETNIIRAFRDLPKPSNSLSFMGGFALFCSSKWRVSVMYVYAVAVLSFYYFGGINDV
jgi:hypothetical protein